MTPAWAQRTALAGLALAAGAASGQVPGENEEARLPYEQLPRHQNEMQLGLSHVQRGRSTALREVRTETAIAFVALSRGISERLEFGLLLPYVLYGEQTTLNAAGTPLGEEHRYGFADPTFRARYGLRREDKGFAVTVGVLATPDWGGRAESFSGQVDILEPFVVLGKSLGAGKAYLRYGYLRRSGESLDAHDFAVGGRHPVGRGFGVVGHVRYVRPIGSANVEAPGAVGAALGGYADLARGMQILAWVGGAGSSASDDEARSRQIAFSLITRF